MGFGMRWTTVKIRGRLLKHGSTKRDHVKAATHKVEVCETYPV